jgi:hypothetical protein
MATTFAVTVPAWASAPKRNRGTIRRVKAMVNNGLGLLVDAFDLLHIVFLLF